jgi:hypothetical protein
MNNRYLRQEYWASPPRIDSSSGNGIKREGGYQITDDLVLDAQFYPGEAQRFTAAWREGGRENTPRGDQVIWGFFYADPVDRDWGSPENPDVYVKIWSDVSGRLDVNFFHVSVPSLKLESRFKNARKSETVTMEQRYARHEYQR